MNSLQKVNLYAKNGRRLCMKSSRKAAAKSARWYGLVFRENQRHMWKGVPFGLSNIEAKRFGERSRDVERCLKCLKESERQGWQSTRNGRKIAAELMRYSMTIGDRVFWPGVAAGVPMIRSGFIEGHRGPKFRICDDSGIRFTKSPRALYQTRAAADAALHRLLLRKP